MPKITVYTTTYCPYCDKAKRLLQKLGASYEEIDLTHNPALRQELSLRYNWRSVPMIVIGEEFIGGADDLYALHAEGELEPRLTSD